MRLLPLLTYGIPIITIGQSIFFIRVDSFLHLLGILLTVQMLCFVKLRTLRFIFYFYFDDFFNIDINLFEFWDD